jgi:hypothetical protein
MLAMTAAILLGGDGFFAGREVDFWGARRPAAQAAEALWEDSSAPAPVKRLLEAPSAETARGYLAWQRERLRRLRAAAEAVDAARRADAAPAAVLYFAREGCRWCERQDVELEGLPVIRVPAGSAAWAEHGVTATPTMVVGERVFRGFTPRAALLEELRR